MNFSRKIIHCRVAGFCHPKHLVCYYNLKYIIIGADKWCWLAAICILRFYNFLSVNTSTIYSAFSNRRKCANFNGQIWLFPALFLVYNIENLKTFKTAYIFGKPVSLYFKFVSQNYQCPNFFDFEQKYCWMYWSSWSKQLNVC